MEAIFELLFNELRRSTRASEPNCREVAARLATEVMRICEQSQRIQNLGDVEVWAVKLARHRLQQCLHYYYLRATAARLDLHSTLSAIVYRYITPSRTSPAYQRRLTLIEDFLQGFYVEALTAFRREGAICETAPISPTYTPTTLLELAEFLSFTERYAKRRIPITSKSRQQLIVLRAQAFVQQQPPETLIDMEQVADSGGSESPSQKMDEALLRQVGEMMLVQEQGINQQAQLRQSVITELINYLEEHQQQDCVEYFVLRLSDSNTKEIETIMNLTPRQRDYLQQRFKYHLIRFALLHRWELVHEWLEAELDKNLGLTPQQWETFVARLDSQQVTLLELKREKLSDLEIAQRLGWTVTQTQKQWFKLLEQAWDIRNFLP
ncbi:heterocyst differentiation protein HetZ [Aerosakkonemataceae cyanobacterium BLCC-F154]|uniref:Heterocyst differentiation protein HetZ n=1 Tax=Floridaenema fluviatile BLCC-F154 TaxID=3153640 RepID=A0ABV4YH21_9CYAN